MDSLDRQSREEDLKKFVWVAYGLLLFAFITGGLSSIVAGVIAYIKFDESVGMMEESHFRWQIKTLWVGLALTIIGVVLLLVWIGGFVLVLTQLWIIYRAVKGGYYFYENREMDNDGILF